MIVLKIVVFFNIRLNLLRKKVELGFMVAIQLRLILLFLTINASNCVYLTCKQH